LREPLMHFAHYDSNESFSRQGSEELVVLLSVDLSLKRLVRVAIRLKVHRVNQIEQRPPS